jgi:L-histidine Nalpha-methyltransferase
MPTSTFINRSKEAFAEDVRAGLGHAGQKELPCKYLYDAVGSALFDVICLLPEYGLCRADERLLRKHAANIVSRLPRPLMVAELGSGSGKKTLWLLEALCRYQSVSYYPVDLSRAALTRCHFELSQIDGVTVAGIEGDYLNGLLEATARREDGQHLLVLFLGSTIGNYGRVAGGEFLGQVRGVLEPGDCLLLGTDLGKPVTQLLHAYDDSLGITAAFNLNLLARINRELDADFELARFRHIVRYDHSERRIEMHLFSDSAQIATVSRAELKVPFRKSETIWTESSYKYDPEEVTEMAERAGFDLEAQWIDAEWPFAESLLIAH